MCESNCGDVGKFPGFKVLGVQSLAFKSWLANFHSLVLYWSVRILLTTLCTCQWLKWLVVSMA